MWISKHVWFLRRYDGHSSNASVIQGKKPILIDPGTTSNGNLDQLVSEMNKAQIRPGKINQIWLTHAHPDHVQVISEWLNRFGGKVLCSLLSKKVLESPSPLDCFVEQQKKEVRRLLKKISPFYILEVLIPYLVAKWTKQSVEDMIDNWKPISIFRTFQDQERIDIESHIRIISLPGHSPDEVGFYVEEDKVLITGDLITDKDRPSLPLINLPSSDIDQALDSLKKIKGLDIEALIPGHGDAIYGKDIERTLEKALTQGQKYKQDILQYYRPPSGFKKVLRKLWPRFPKDISLKEKSAILCVLGKVLREEGLI